MDNRMLLAIVLSIAILIGWQYYVEKTSPPPMPDAAPKQQLAKEEAKKEQIPVPVLLPKSADAQPEKTVTVENNLYKVVLSTRGGTLTRVELKEYKDKEGKHIVLKGESVLMPLSLGADDTFLIGQANFALRGSDIKLTEGAKTGSIVFEYASGEVKVRRTYTFSYGMYGFTLKDEVTGLSTYWITLGKDFGIYEPGGSEHFGPVILQHADREAFEADKLKDPKYFKEGVKWIAEEDKYFFSAIAPKTKIDEAKVWKKDGYALVGLKMSGGSNEYLVIVGPKDYDRLKKYDAGLEHIVDFGWFSFLAVPLFWFLQRLYDLIGNYGWAIIVLTAIVRIPFIPIINRGQLSMKKLQDIQPKISELREKYKKDPQRMQQELTQIYKKHKVNPMGGCLPMVLQIPVFFALYKVLLVAVELRDAPFILWIYDLSQKDPYYILPIVMGVTMVIQQKMTPSTMDPKQAKIMMLMPVFFTFLFLNFASGLVLYWLANNVFSIIQQLYVNKKAKKQAAAA